MKQKIAVVGAGLSGIATVKELLEEGHDVKCYEALPDIGGVFNELGTYDSVMLTVSNYFMAYSDFMPYEDDVRFWTRAEYKAYLDRYVDHFDLKKHMQFNCRLVGIDNRENSVVITLETQSGASFSEEFDRLAICSGQFQEPNIPSIPGLESFPGEVIHSSQYRNKEELNGFAGKRVLCLGMGESAADVVTEVAEIASCSTLSLRRHHVFSQRMVSTNPIDVAQSRLWHSLPAKTKSQSVRDMWSRYRDNTTSKDPMHHFADHVVKASDEPGSVVTKTERIFEAVAAGMKVDIGGIKAISGAEVEFNSGHKEAFDAILLCTGFKFSLPFLSNQVDINDIRDCYLQAFHPQLKDKIALIGFVRPQQGGVPLMAELQARYYALLCSGKRSLPDNMAELAQQDKQKWQAEFYETPHVFGLVNGLRFNEQIADLIGCRPPRPNPITSPNAFFIYWFHHIWPSQYRLVGPGAREEARANWQSAPSVLSINNRISFVKKLDLLKSLSVSWLKSLLKQDPKERWRPTFSKRT